MCRFKIVGCCGIATGVLVPGMFFAQVPKGASEVHGMDKIAAGVPRDRVADEDDAKGAEVFSASDAGNGGPRADV